MHHIATRFVPVNSNQDRGQIQRTDMTFFAGKRLGPHEALSPSLAPASRQFRRPGSTRGRIRAGEGG
jgi:hypothetical protein